MSIKKQLIKIAYNHPEFRPELLPLIKMADEEAEDAPASKGKGGMSGKFVQFMKERGDDKVSNPNPKSRDRFPQIKVKSLSSSPEGKRMIKDLFQKWVDSQKETAPKTQPKNTPKETPTKPRNRVLTESKFQTLEKPETLGGKVLKEHASEFTDRITKVLKSYFRETVGFPSVRVGEDTISFNVAYRDLSKRDPFQEAFLGKIFEARFPDHLERALEKGKLEKPVATVNKLPDGFRVEIQFQQSLDNTPVPLQKKVIYKKEVEKPQTSLGHSLEDTVEDFTELLESRFTESIDEVFKGKYEEYLGKPTVTYGEDSVKFHIETSKDINSINSGKIIKVLKEFSGDLDGGVDFHKTLQYQKKEPVLEYDFEEGKGFTVDLTFEDTTEILPLDRKVSKEVATKVLKDIQKKVPKAMKAEDFKIKSDYMGVLLTFKPGKKPTKKALENLKEQFEDSVLKNSENSRIYDITLSYYEKDNKVYGQVTFEGQLNRLMVDGRLTSWDEGHLRGKVERGLGDQFGASDLRVVPNGKHAVDFEFKTDMDLNDLGKERELEDFFKDKALDEFEVEDVYVNVGVDGTVTVTVTEPEKLSHLPL